MTTQLSLPKPSHHHATSLSRAYTDAVVTAPETKLLGLGDMSLTELASFISLHALLQSPSRLPDLQVQVLPASTLLLSKSECTPFSPAAQVLLTLLISCLHQFLPPGLNFPHVPIRHPHLSEVLAFILWMVTLFFYFILL